MVSYPLVILCGGQSDGSLPIDQSEEACLLSFQILLDDGLGVAPVIENGHDRLMSLFAGEGDSYALAAGKTIRLDDDRHAFLLEKPKGVPLRSHPLIAGCWYVFETADVFGEALRAFKPGCRLGRTEGFHTR